MKRLLNYSITFVVAVSLMLSGVFGAITEVHAANPAPVQTYYVTLPETDGLRILDSIASYADVPMYTYFSISIAVTGTYVYYDQKEDGYAADIANPSSTEIYSPTNVAGVQIWGNGIAADGCAPNINGVAFTCTNAADVLNAGDVIIPYNSIPLTGYGATYVRDTFSTQSYSRQDGNASWSTNWVETGDSTTSPTSGSIWITNNTLQFRSTTGTETGDTISRGLTLPAGGDCAGLKFVLGQNEIDANEDRLAVEVSADGGTNYTVLDIFDSPTDVGTINTPYSDANKWYDISGYATNTRVRFRFLDELESGEFWSIDNIQVTWGCPVRDPNLVFFDGRDKVAASNTIAMTRATWATSSGTLNAFAHEMYPTAEWGTHYVAPVGTDTANAGSMFEYSALSIMASQNNTTVQIDKDGDTVYETSIILNEGGTYLVMGTEEGAAVLADKRVQVLFISGDIGSTYASRDMNLLTKDEWGYSYWSPVGTQTGTGGLLTRLFIFNPGPSSIYVTCEKYGVANDISPQILAKDVWTTDLTDGQGAHCYVSDSLGNPDTDTTKKISVLGTVDTTGTAYDWSFTVYPNDFLTSEGLVGLGLGKDPTDTTSTENAGPIWVTAACPADDDVDPPEPTGTYVYVDWNNDGTADPVDTDGDYTAEAGSENGILVNRLQSVRLYEPGADEEEYDQTGARVWSRTASSVGHGGDPGCLLALAWGSDPDEATAGSPGLDVGTSIPPLRMIEGTKELQVVTDNAPVGVLNPGDIVYYNISVENMGSTTVLNVYVYDTIPDHTSYVPGTTEYKLDSGSWTGITDDGIGDGFPLDKTGGVYLGDLAVGSTYYVRFKIELDDGDYEEIENCEETYTDAGDLEGCVLTPVATRDWGDLPDSYGTTASAIPNSGPRHSYSGLKLGYLWDYEAQGQQSGTAVGDDTAQLDDEDGVISVLNYTSWEAGTGGLQVVATGAPGCLNVWMDFTDDTGSGAGTLFMDGDFTKAGGYDAFSGFSEHVVVNQLMAEGPNYVPVPVPPMIFNQQAYFFRLRLTPPVGGECTAAVQPTGFEAGGEVEDYLFSFGAPTAVDLLDFSAAAYDDEIIVTWETATEIDHLGFNLYRSPTMAGERVKLNENLIRSDNPLGRYLGAAYEFADPVTPEAGQAFYYWLEDIDIHGVTGIHGPVLVVITD